MSSLAGHQEEVLMLRLVGLERWVVATISRGFQLWHVNGRQTGKISKSNI